MEDLNKETTIEVQGIFFETKEQYKLPLLIDGNEIDIDGTIEDELLIEDDTEITVEEWLEENGITIVDDTYVLVGAEDDYYYTDEDTYIAKDECSLFATEHYYEYCNPQTSNEFYELDDGRFGMISEDDSTLYIWDDKKEMIRENFSRIEAFHNGNDEVKKIFAFDEDIVTIVEDERDGSNSFDIIAEFSLDVPNPAYEFEHIGLTDDNTLVYYSINNCNVCIYDYPGGFGFTLEELKNMIDRIEAYDGIGGDEHPNNIEYPLPIKYYDEIVEFLKENKE